MRRVLRRIYLVAPLIPQLKELLKLNQDSMEVNYHLDLVVDYTPEGFLGDLWLMVYYFVATILPWNWGPRVFRD